ncbi:MAG: hypothetical protein BGO36_08110 [Burkholderiales bacterium 68-10]|nr:MAG: hypothetical protein BGO36_08110 [Burkholderiales bacterium 68-10]
MRTTLDIEPDVMAAAKEMARQENVAVGKVISRLVRQALTRTDDVTVMDTPETATSALTGFTPFPPRGVIVSNELIDRLRDAEGV